MFHGRVGVVPASALLLGVAFGGVAKLGFDAKSLRFSPLVFFYGLLPIIIFNAGYSLKKKVILEQASQEFHFLFVVCRAVMYILFGEDQKVRCVGSLIQFSWILATFWNWFNY